MKAKSLSRGNIQVYYALCYNQSMNRLKIMLLLFLLPAMAFAELNLSISPKKIETGSCLTIIISGEGLSSARGNFINQNFAFYKDGSVFKGIVGVPCELSGGEYPLLIKWTDFDGEVHDQAKNIPVIGHLFGSVSFWLKPAKKK